MLKLQAFLALEKSVASTMHAAWDHVARRIVSQVGPLLAARKWDDAHDIANKLSMFGVVERHRKRLEELAVSSFLFGAHNVTGSLQATSYVKREQSLPYSIQLALDQMTDMVEFHGAEMVRQELHKAIRREELRKYDMSSEDLEEAGMQNPEQAGPRKKKKVRKDDDMAERLNQAVTGTGRMAIDIAANLTTSRLVTLGFLAEAINKKIETYQINEVLDEKTCPVCQYMHGKTFYVQKEYGRVMQALGTQDPQQLKSLAPWPNQSKAGLAKLNAMSLEEMQAEGYGSPPYHPGCRGVLALVGTVTEEIPLGGLVSSP